MTPHTLEDLKDNYPAVYARAEELSGQMRSSAIRANMLNQIRINSGEEHVIRAFDKVIDPESRQQTFLCVESTTMGGPFYIGKTDVILFEDEAEYERSQAEWKSRTR